MTNDSKKKLIADHIQLSWNEGKYEALKKIVTPGFYYQTTFSDDILSLNEYIQFIQLFRTSMSDLNVDIEEIMCEGDRVMSYVSFSGIVETPVMGIPASDKIITLPAISFWSINRGKIASLETMINISGVERQLGTSIKPGLSVQTVLKTSGIQK